ncbi:MAG TPA: hypothetical protein DC054_16460 [Blastocatellia bacterium]|nr:hypothetical protein [Blastocatellia bacterium]
MVGPEVREEQEETVAAAVWEVREPIAHVTKAVPEPAEREDLEDPQAPAAPAQPADSAAEEEMVVP